VLGAGGAARAVVYVLAQSGRQVCLAARRLEEAGELVISVQRSTFSDQQSSIEDRQLKILVLPLESASLASLLHKLNSAPLLIVNATPVGMVPNVESSPWPTTVPLPRNAAVYDLVYNPPETTLVRTARAAGLPATTGLGMLIEQAALSFERWTGLSAPREAMWQAAGRMPNGIVNLADGLSG
jgi:shikimate dehydrogenase